MNNETGMKPITFGVFLIIAIYSISLIMDYGETTDSDLDESVQLSDLDEEAQLRDEIDRLYNEAMEDSYVGESDEAKAKRFGQKFGKEIDEELLELGIVDSNYKYKNFYFANRYFELVTINHQKTLPDTTDGITAKESDLTALYHIYTYVIEEFPPSEFIEAIRAGTQSQEYIQSQCDVFYASKYQRANNTTVRIQVYDLSGELVSKVILDESTCY